MVHPLTVALGHRFRIPTRSDRDGFQGVESDVWLIAESGEFTIILEIGESDEIIRIGFEPHDGCARGTTYFMYVQSVVM
jgi:hypothetical protein